MYILGINFISFTAQIYNALHMQRKKGDFGILRVGHGPFAAPLNPPMAHLWFQPPLTPFPM